MENFKSKDMSKNNGNIIEVTEENFGEKITRLSWSSDRGYFGQLTIEYLDNGHYDIDAEFIGLETVAEILKKWIETKSK